MMSRSDITCDLMIIINRRDVGFQQRLSHKSEMRTRQCRLALWVVRVWLSLIESSRRFSNKEGERMNTCVCAVSFSNAETPLSSRNCEKHHYQ